MFEKIKTCTFIVPVVRLSIRRSKCEFSIENCAKIIEITSTFVFEKAIEPILQKNYLLKLLFLSALIGCSKFFKLKTSFIIVQGNYLYSIETCGLYPQTLSTILPSNGQNKCYENILLYVTSMIFIMFGHFTVNLALLQRRMFLYSIYFVQ